MANKGRCRGCAYLGDGICRKNNRLMEVINFEPVDGFCPLEYNSKETEGMVTDKYIISLIKTRSQGKIHRAVDRWLRDQYITQGKSILQMSKIVGMSANSLWVKMKKYGIPIRSRSEGQLLSIKKRKESGERY